ncbi:MAG: LUD domain-containing protein [bacterium]
MMRDDEARDRILDRIRAALEGRETLPHPGGLPACRDCPDPVDRFAEVFEANGGETVRFESQESAREWLASFAEEFATMAPGVGVPGPLLADLPAAAPEEAAFGISMARGGAGETGSLLLDSRQGRRGQILPPVHLIWVRERDIHPTLGELLESVKEELPSALALHSGPSKSADIGQVTVRGVHGPRRVVAAILP